MGTQVSALATQLNGDLAASYAAADRAQRVYDRGLGRLGSSMQSFGRQASLVTAGLALLGTQSFQTYARINSLQLGLESVTGSAAAAKEEFRQLMPIVRLPGLGLEEAAKGDVRLQAIGFSAREAKKDIQEVGNAIAKDGEGKFALDSILTQFTQMAGKAKVLSEDLKPILTASPSIAKAVKDLFGTVDSEQISAKLQAAGRGPKDFINDLVLQLSKLERVKGGPANAVENLGDSFKLAQFQIGEAADKTFDLTGKLNALGDLAGNAANGFSSMSPAAQAVTLGVVGLTAAVGPLALGIGTLIQLGPTFVSGLGAMKTATLALATPIGAIAVAGTALVGTLSILGVSIAHYSEGLETTIDKSALLKTASDAVAAATVNERTKLESLLAVARDETVSRKARLQAVSDLNALSPQYLGNLRLETINTAQATKAISDYTNALTLKAKVQVLSDQAAKAQIDADRAAAKSAKEYVDRTRFSRDQIAVNLKTTFSFDQQGDSNREFDALAKRRKDAEVQRTKQAADLLNKELQKAYADAAKTGVTVDAPKLKPFDYLGIDLSGSELKKAKDRLKQLKDDIFAGRKAGTDVSAQVAEYQQLKAQIDAASDSLKTGKTANDGLGESLTSNERILKRLTRELKQYGDTADGSRSRQVALLQDAVAADKELSNNKPVDLGQKVQGLDRIERLRAGLEGLISPLTQLPGLASRLSDLRSFGSGAFLSNEVGKIQAIAARDALEGIAPSADAIAKLRQYTLLLRQADDAVQLQGLEVASLNGGSSPRFEAVAAVLGQLRTTKENIDISVQEIVGAMSAQREQLAGAASGLLSGIGEGIGRGQNPLKGALQFILNILGDYAIKIGTAALISSKALLLAAPFLAGATLPQGIGLQLTGAGLIVAGGVVKGLAATAFANGGIVSGPTLGLVGEYAGARNNPEVIAPLDKLRSMLPSPNATQVFIPELRLGYDAIYIGFNKGEEAYLSQS